MNLRVFTLGCRLNNYESELIKEQGQTLPDNNIDTIVVNTCAVTGEAERQCRQLIRKLRKENPTSFIIVTGCAAQINPEQYAKMPEVDRVLGNKEKLSSVNFTPTASNYNVGTLSTLSQTEFTSPLINGYKDKSKAFLQIQQGCNNKCTFCIVTKARGTNRSCSPTRILQETKKILESGIQEIILSGVNIADYGKDNADYGNLTDLTKLILKTFPSLPRLRFSSLDIAGIQPDFIHIMQEEERLMPHLHFSLQSGDDLILKRMGRRHSAEQTLGICEQLKKARPDIIFGADFITGFPTETDTMFSNTVKIVQNCPITLTHVFPYSERPDTPAAKMPPVNPSLRKERARELRKLSSDILHQYLQSRINKTESILLECPNYGINEHYIPVNIKTPARTGQIYQVRITGLTDNELIGDLL